MNNVKKLSKRDGQILQFIEQYRDLGYLPEALLLYRIVRVVSRR